MIPYKIVQKHFIRNILVTSSNRSFSRTSILFEGSSKSLYDDLGLDPNASSQDIKNAFIRISKEVHPDKNPDNPEAAAKFFEISNAYNTLSNAKKRRAYDRGQLGRVSSVADRESASHQFEKEGFVDSRKQFRDRYSRSKGIRDDLDNYVKSTSTVNFHRKRYNKDQLGGSTGQEIPRVWAHDHDPRFGKKSSPRSQNRSAHGNGFSSNDHSSGGGGGFVFIIMCPMMFYLVYKVIS